MTEPESRQPSPAERPPDPKAVNPFYRGARFSEVARAVASPTDPEMRERIRARTNLEDGEREPRGNGPLPGHAPAPGR
jgi:hypothetical protein